MAWFSLSPKDMLKKAGTKTQLKNELATTFASFPDKSQSLLAVGDADWNGSHTQAWIIKVNAKNHDWIVNKSPIWSVEKTNPKAFKDGKKLYTVMGGNDIKITWRKTKVSPSKPTTQMQELGSAWILERAVNDKKTTFTSVQDIVNDKVTYDKLVKIFRGEVPDDWIFTYFAQQKRLFNVYKGNSPYSVYNRDGGFMDYISDIVTTNFDFPKKDSWNPADIWIIKGNQKKFEAEIDKIVEGDDQNAIYQLNDYLIVKYLKKEIMGLSLKKVSGKKAKFEVVNISRDKKMLIDTKDPLMNYPVTPKCFQSKFVIKTGKKNFTQDVRLVIKSRGRKVRTYDFQIKANSSESTTGSNLKFEATQKGAGGARLGKAPVDKIVSILHEMGQTGFQNKYDRYPATAEEFTGSAKGEEPFVPQHERGERYFRGVIQDLIRADMVTDTKDIDLIINNIIESFYSPEDRTTNTRCKLMGLDFFWYMLQLGDDKMREFGTDMVYIAQKKRTRKNDKFGPFGKVY